MLRGPGLNLKKKESSNRRHLPGGTSKDHSRGLSHMPSSDIQSPDNLTNQTKCPISYVGMSKLINTVMHTMTIILKR